MLIKLSRLLLKYSAKIATITISGDNGHTISAMVINAFPGISDAPCVHFLKNVRKILMDSYKTASA